MHTIPVPDNLMFRLIFRGKNRFVPRVDGSNISKKIFR